MLSLMEVYSMTDQFVNANKMVPITPPPELVEEWIAQVWHEGTPVRVGASDIHIATQAARWGSDQELDACCDWIYNLFQRGLEWSKDLRAARRPKPPSLKQQALETLRQIPIDPEAGVSSVELDTIRRALEQLND